MAKHGKVLATRELGTEVADAVRAGAADADGLVVDFSDVRVASSPFLDEIASALHSMIAHKPERFVVLAHLNEDLLDTLELVAERRDFVLTAIAEGGEFRTIAGTRQLDETLAAAQELHTFTASELADRLELKLPNLHQRLNQLQSAGALTRRDDPSAKRGKRLIFTTPAVDELPLAASL